MKPPLRCRPLLAAFVTLALVASGFLHAQEVAPLQTWTATDGRVIRAKFVKLDGESVVVEKDGTRFAVQLSKLNPASVALAKKLARAVGASSAPEGFALIPAGVFTMGDTLDGDPDARPHQVTVSAFFMQQKEVSKAQWDAVRTWGLQHGYLNLAGGAGKAADHPVQEVSWYAIVKWCNARSEQEGLTPCYTVAGAVYRTGDSAPECDWSANGYRLPTEAEWEKAARGNLSGKRFPWGDTIKHSQANYGSDKVPAYDVNPGRGAHPSYSKGKVPFTSPGGKFAANGYGLFDMAGNVGEWCWDCYGSYSSSAQTDPRGPDSAASRVGRGGGWNNGARNCRVADRGHGSPGDAGTVGFRLARRLVPQ